MGRLERERSRLPGRERPVEESREESPWLRRGDSWHGVMR